MNEEEINKKVIYPKGTMQYEDLRKIIFDYFKEKKGVTIGSISIDYLAKQLSTGKDNQPFFVLYDDIIGETRFNIPKEDIQKIVKSYMADKNCELTDIEYGNNVTLSYKPDVIIDKDNEEDAKLNINYIGTMKYEDLRKIIFDYYKETKGVELGSISIDYLKSKLTGGNGNQPFFIRKDGEVETRFDIPTEEIKEIVNSYLESKNYELEQLDFDHQVRFIYKEGEKKIEKENNQEVERDDNNEFVPRVTGTNKDELYKQFATNDFGSRLTATEENNEYQGLPTINLLNQKTDEIVEKKVEPLSKVELTPALEQTNETQKVEPLPVKDEELERTARENRKFTILQRERAINDAQKASNRSAIMAGVCILGATAAFLFSGQDINQVMQHELNAIYSWEALGQYIQDLGPLTTLLSAGAGAFIAKNLKDNRKLRAAQHEFEDFNASLENNNVQEVGGNENARSR